MNLEFLNSSEKKKLMEELKENYGIEKLNFLLIKSGFEKIRGFTGSLSKEEIAVLSREVNIETIGLYLAKEEQDGLRLSFDAPSILGISKNIIEISEVQAHEWLKGNNLDIQDKETFGFVVLKYKDFFLGCGKASQGRITNFVPKERRLKG